MPNEDHVLTTDDGRDLCLYALWLLYGIPVRHREGRARLRLEQVVESEQRMDGLGRLCLEQTIEQLPRTFIS